MAKATEQQVKDLERALTEQFKNLVDAAAFRIAVARKYGLDSAAFKKYNNFFVPIVKKWIVKEVKYERANLQQGIKGIIASGDLKANDFYYSAQLPKLQALVKKFNAEKITSGIGFIPLLVWAAIAIIGLFTAEEVVDDLTTTTQEKAELMKQTQETAAALGLTPEQASAMISQTQAEASQGSGIGDTVKWAVAGVAAIFILPKLLESFGSKKAA